MKKLIVFMPSFKAGGAQRVLSIIMNQMAKRGDKVTLALIKDKAPIEYYLDKNVKVIRNEKFSKNKMINIMYELMFIRSVMKNNSGANVLSFITMYNLYVIVAAFGLKINLIVSERNDPSRSLERDSRFLEKIRQILYCKADNVVFQTYEAKKYFESQKGINGTIIPNPLSDNLPIKSSYNDEKIFVAVARLEEQKNYPLMMDAMNEVAYKYPDFKLFIYGKGSEEAKLKNYRNSLQNKNNIEFKGFTDNVPLILSNAYAFVSSSDFEGISNSMLDALAIGVPCICTDCPSGGARMFISDHKNGFLVPIQDKQKLSDAMIELIENPEYRDKFGHNSISVRDSLNADVIFNKWYNLFR